MIGLVGCSFISDADENEPIRQSSDVLYEDVEITQPARIIRDWSERDGAHLADLAVDGSLSSDDIQVPDGYELGPSSTAEDGIASFKGPDPLDDSKRCTVTAWRLPDPTFDLRAGEEAVRLSVYCGFGIPGSTTATTD